MTQGALLNYAIVEAFGQQHPEFRPGWNYNNQGEQSQRHALVAQGLQVSTHFGQFEWSSAGNTKLGTLALYEFPFTFSRIATTSICACASGAVWAGKGSFYVNKPHMKALSNAQHKCALITMCLSMCIRHTVVIEKHCYVKCTPKSYAAKYLLDLRRAFIPTMHYAQGFLGYPRNH